MSLRKSILNDSVLSLHIAKLAQTLPECLDAGRLTVRRGTSQITNPRDLRWLLRLGERAKRKEHSAKSKDRDFFLHVFFSVFIHLSLDT